jgi:hypothetical protein
MTCQVDNMTTEHDPLCAYVEWAGTVPNCPECQFIAKVRADERALVPTELAKKPESEAEQG